MHNLLIVDDYETIRDGLEKGIATYFGEMFSIDKVANGREACDYVAKTPPKFVDKPTPDLIFMDDQMNGGMSGVEATKEIRSSGYEKPIILMSFDEYTEEMLESIGATDFVDKKGDLVGNVRLALKKYFELT